MFCPSHAPWLAHPNDIWWAYKLWSWLCLCIPLFKPSDNKESVLHRKEEVKQGGASLLNFRVSGSTVELREAVGHGLSSVSSGCHHGIWWLGCGRISPGRRPDPSWQPRIYPRWWLTHVSTNPVPFESWLIYWNSVTWRSEVCGSFVLPAAAAEVYMPWVGVALVLAWQTYMLRRQFY
jgi:hypothetical protein